MKTLKISKNIFLAIYFGLFLIGLIFFLTGYSFSFRPLNILLLIIIVLYPILKFIRSALTSWLKISIGLLLIITTIIIFWNVPAILAFGQESTRNVQKWNFNNYKICLNKKQGWAGGPFLQYDLIRYQFFGLINKNIAVGYPNQKEENDCKIKLKEDSYSDITLFEFDKCKLKLERIKSNSH